MKDEGGRMKPDSPAESSPPAGQPALYPLFRDLAGQRCVVVGGGRVAARKVADLVRCGARVRVVSPEFCADIEAMDGIERVAGPYEPACLAGAVVVIAATDDPDVNRRVSADARGQGAWVNVVDEPELCDFHVPAVARRGPVQIAFSTGGASPALARRMREAVETVIDEAYGQLAALVGELRPRVVRDIADADVRSRLLKQFASAEWLERLRRDGPEATRSAMEQLIAEAV